MNHISLNIKITKLWEGIKELVSIKTTPTSIEINKQIIIEPKVICNNFNNFVNIADNVLINRKYEGNKHFTEYLNTRMCNTFAFNLCDASEIYLIINQLSVDKASGPNGFPTKIMQMINREISSPLKQNF